MLIAPMNDLRRTSDTPQVAHARIYWAILSRSDVT
jgi:hypothetical protein